MRVFILILSLFSTNVLACGESNPKTFAPFAINISDEYSNNDLNLYEINFPIKDVKERDFFLNELNAVVDGLFALSVRYSEWNEYEGEFYTAYLRLDQSLEEKTSLVGNYNGGNKKGTSIYGCLNFKEYKLSELLKTKAPNKRVREELETNPPSAK